MNKIIATKDQIVNDENWKFEASTEMSPSSQRADRITARSLVDRNILIISTTFVDGRFAAVIRKTNGGELLWFYPGKVVTEQLNNTRLPTWATMQIIEGKNFPYYKLTLAETANVERIAPWKLQTL